MELYNALDATMVMATVYSMLGMPDIYSSPEHLNVESEATWLKDGDFSTYYFKLYSQDCQTLNTITPDRDSDCPTASTCRYKAGSTYLTSDAFDSTSLLYRDYEASSSYYIDTTSSCSVSGNAVGSCLSVYQQTFNKHGGAFRPINALKEN